MKDLRDWRFPLKRLVSLVCLATFSFAAQSDSFLSKLKQEQLDIDKKTNELESDNLQLDWINTINGSYTFVNSDQVIDDRETGMFSVSLEQPIFKSGGIYFAIKYASANREFLKLSTSLSEQTLIKSVMSSWYAIKKLELQMKRQEALIENAKIDIVRKKEQYESGFLDSSYLDNAILSKSSLQKSLLDMQASQHEQIMAFKALSDADYMAIEPPRFVMITEEDFLQNSLAVQQKNANSLRSEYLKKMTISNYLPTVSLTAGYYDSRVDSNGNIENDTYKNVGLKVSMPLFDINIARNIEIKRLAHLKSQIEIEDTKRSELSEYLSATKEIQLLQKKVELAEQDYELYASLLHSTTELYEAGEKTSFDVDTLKNSQETMKYDKMIYEIEIQMALLELYAKMNAKL